MREPLCWYKHEHCSAANIIFRIRGARVVGDRLKLIDRYRSDVHKTSDFLCCI